MNECRTCHRPFGGEHRSCEACGRAILRNHKWHVRGSRLFHDDCQNPTMALLIRSTEPEQAEFDTSPPPEEAQS